MKERPERMRFICPKCNWGFHYAKEFREHKISCTGMFIVKKIDVIRMEKYSQNAFTKYLDMSERIEREFYKKANVPIPFRKGHVHTPTVALVLETRCWKCGKIFARKTLTEREFLELEDSITKAYEEHEHGAC